MQSYVYQEAMEYQSSSKLLSSIRKTVKELRRAHPELSECSLADVSLRKGRDAVNVTLFFEENA